MSSSYNSGMLSRHSFPWLLAALMLVVVTPALAQRPEVREFAGEQKQLTRTGMAVLGGWALANMASGAVLMRRTSGPDRHFYAMNLYWNTINLVLAGAGYYGATQPLGDSLTSFGVLREHYNLEKILLLNAGLDAAYLVTGFYLRERANRSAQPERLQGYGRSLLLQGGFLLVFDVALFLTHNQHLQKARPWLDKLSFTGNGVQLVLPLGTN